VRTVALGVLVLLVLVALLSVINYERSEAQQTAPQPATELLAVSSDADPARQQVVVIDSKTRVMSVYHIEHATGAISLKSVRSIQADLQMDEFNTQSPLPREIRAILNEK
jgi:hypothetical protein